MPCVIDAHAMLGHAGLDDLPIADVAAGCPRRSRSWPCRPADDTAAAAGLIRDIPNLSEDQP